MPQSLASDSVYSGGKLPPTLTPTGHFAGKPTLPISRSVTLIGARKQARLQLISSTVSQNHALIVNADSGPYIRDLASRMGVSVNGRQAAELSLSDGDEIQIGRFTFRFNASPNAQPPKGEKAAPGRVKVEGVDYAVPIDGRSMLIGRRDSCDIHLLEDSVSTTHAIIFEMDARRYIRDLASRTGTFVNGKQIHQVEIMPGDELRIGESVMQYIADGSPGVTQDEMVPADLGAEPADLGAEPADLDLELEPTEPVVPVVPPTRRPPRPASVADANAAAAAALEMVQDQAAELDMVELAPVELEARAPEPVSEMPVRPTPQPKAPSQVGRAPVAPPKPVAPPPPPVAPPPPLEEVELEPLEMAGEIGGAGFQGLQEVRGTDEVELAPEPELEPELEPLAETSARSSDEIDIDISPEESFELEPVEAPAEEWIEPVAEEPAPVVPSRRPPVQVHEPAPVIPSPPPLEIEEVAIESEIPVEVEPEPVAETPQEIEVEPAEAPVEEVAPLAEVQPPAPEPEPEPVPEPVREEVELSPLALEPLTSSPPTKREELDLAPLAMEPVAEAPAPEPAPEPVAEMPPPSKPKLIPPSPPKLAPKAKREPVIPPAPIPAPAVMPIPPIPVPVPIPIPSIPAIPAAEAPKPKQPKKSKKVEPPAPPVEKPIVAEKPKKTAKPAKAPKSAPKAADAILPLDAFAAPPEETEVAPIPELEIDESFPALAFDDATIEALEDEIGMSPRLAEMATPSMDAGAGATPAGLDLGEIEELPDSVFTAALDDTAFEVPPLDFGEEAEAGDVTAETADAGFDLGLEEPPAAEAPTVEEEPVIEEELEPVAATPAVEEEPAAIEEEEHPIAEAPPEEEQLAETISPVEATPESAQALDDVIEETPIETQDVGELREVELTDSTFGREVSEFAAESTGPIVDEAPAPAVEPEAEAELEVEPEIAEVEAPEQPSIAEEEVQEEEQPVAEAEAQPSELELEPEAPTPQPAELEVEPDLEVEPEVEAEAEVPPPAVPPTRFGPGSSQLHLEPLDEIPAARSMPRHEPLEPASDDFLLEMEEAGGDAESTKPAAEERSRLFDLEPIEAPVPAAEDEQITLTPTDPLAPVEEALEPVDVEPVEVEPVEVEPVEVEAIESTEAPPQELTPTQIDSDIDLEPVEVEPEPIAEAPVDESPVDESPVATAQDAISDAEIELALEASMGLTAEPAPVVPSRPSPVSETPISETPRLTPAPPAPGEPPVKPRTKLEEFNWGANQEHFFGGMPLRLSPGQAPVAPMHRATPPQEPIEQPVAPAARAPETPQVRPPAAPAPQQPQPQFITPQQRPAARKPTTPQPRPGKAPKGAAISTGFDGLAAGGEGDAFSQTPGSLTAGFAPGLMNDVFAGGQRIGGGANIPPTQPPADGGAAAAPSAPAPRPRRASKADPMGDAWAPVTPPEVQPPPAAPQRPQQPAGSHIPPQMPPAPPPARKKRRWFGLKLLLPLMILFAAAAAGGVISLLPANSVVSATLKYENFQGLKEGERRAEARTQLELLKDAKYGVRAAAADKVRAKRIDPGFLAGDPKTYLLLADAANIDTEKGTMTLAYRGQKLGPVTWPAAGPQDQVRLLAVLGAMSDANGQKIRQARTHGETVEGVKASITKNEAQIAEIKKQIDALAAGTERPDASQRASLEAEVQRLTKAQTETQATAERLTQELAALQNNGSAVAAATNDPKAIPIPAPPAEQDGELELLQSELKDIETKIAAARAGQSDKARIARTQLDGALESFNTSIAAAKAAGNSNPELLAYLSAADKLLKESRELTDGLVARQEKQASELTDLKVKLNDKLLARRAEVWKKDPELLKLMDQRDIQTRRYNAAVGQGLTKEAGDIKTDLSYLEAAIKARQTLVADDSFNADAINQLQKTVETAQQGLEQDRKTTLASLDELQATFSKSAPATLAPEQKKIADEIDQKLSAVSAARKQYTLDTDAASQAVDKEIRVLQIAASQTASKIVARKEQLGQITPISATPRPVPVEDNSRVIADKTAELANAKKSADEVKTALTAATAKLTDFNKRLESANAVGNQRDALLRNLDTLNLEKTNLSNKLEQAENLRKTTVYPIAPSDNDVVFNGEADKRPMYALLASGGVVAIFAMMMAFSLIGSRGEEVPAEQGEEFAMSEPGAAEAEFEIEPERDEAEHPVQA